MEGTRPLRFCSERPRFLSQTSQITNVVEFTPLPLVADFRTLLGTYGLERHPGLQGNYNCMESFSIVFEPFDDRFAHIPDLVLQPVFLDASLSMKAFFNSF